MKLLEDEFIKKYKNVKPSMSEIGEFTFLRTYSRYLKEKNRREMWFETCKRAVEFNCSLDENVTREEAEQLFDNLFNLRTFLSGRTLWIGGTKASKLFPMSNFNCAFTVIDSFEAILDVFYLLMIGAGVGCRILKDDAKKMPSIRKVKIVHKDYCGVPKKERLENTKEKVENNKLIIIIGDSKNGWSEGLKKYFDALYKNEFENINEIHLNYDNIRPKGEILKTFGGRASGHESLKNMFVKIHRVLDNSKSNISTLECLDICNIIAENVVLGGVRRSAEMIIVDSDDADVLNAKNDIYKDGKCNQEIVHRYLSNNSVLYDELPNRETFKEHFKKIRYSGEPGFIMSKEATRRNKNFKGVNPCGEILLDDKQTCNLVTTDLNKFIKDGVLDEEKLFKAYELIVRASFRLTLLKLELPEWDEKQNRDRLLGVSLTGIQDAFNTLKYNKEEKIKLLNKLRELAIKTANDYADSLNLNRPMLVTTVKPEGTISLLSTVSSGVHYSHSPYYIRRIRVNTSDPLCKLAEHNNYPIYPEVGQDIKNCMTKVVEFPVKAPKGKTKYEVSAVEQFEDYLMFQEHYTQHNTSITIHVKNDEWEQLEEVVFKNIHKIIGITFLSIDDSFYQLLPYESINEEEYLDRKEKCKSFSAEELMEYENLELEFDLIDDDCVGGACPVR